MPQRQRHGTRLERADRPVALHGRRVLAEYQASAAHPQHRYEQEYVPPATYVYA